MLLRTLLAATALTLAAAPANALVIASLYSTGVATQGVATTGNGADPHWTLVGGTAFNGGTNGSFPIGPWVGDTGSVRWITPTANAADGVPVQNYTFETTFTLGAFTSANFSGRFAADDSVTEVRLNGVTIPISGGGFSFLTNFSYAGNAFQTGLNTLSFDVINSGAGPTGLQVEIAGASFVPEPATWGLMVVGFGLVGVSARRRKNVVAA